MAPYNAFDSWDVSFLFRLTTPRPVLACFAFLHWHREDSPQLAIDAYAHSASGDYRQTYVIVTRPRSCFSVLELLFKQVVRDEKQERFSTLR